MCLLRVQQGPIHMVEWAHPDSKSIVHADYGLPRQVQERIDLAETIPSAGLFFKLEIPFNEDVT